MAGTIYRYRRQGTNLIYLCLFQMVIIQKESFLQRSSLRIPLFTFLDKLCQLLNLVWQNSIQMLELIRAGSRRGPKERVLGGKHWVRFRERIALHRRCQYLGNKRSCRTHILGFVGSLDFLP